MTITTATATREGTDQDNADAGAIYAAADGAVAAAVIDGVGHTPGTSAIAPVLATVAARVAATRGALAGLMSAAQLVSDPGPNDDEPNAVAAVAVTYPDGETVVAWVGDCDAYGWNGHTLTRYTTPHTVGEQLRRGGVAPELAEEYDNRIKTSLVHAVVATVSEATVHDPLVILTSDGVSDQITPTELEELVRTHHAAPQDLAHALVTAASEDEDGYRDDATVAILQVKVNAAQ
ncbi:SpoIIE family protein phosphatase [Streptomyces sp. NBC_01433]|uniref:PP2C family protein-serine/threonine phosphatase n=1 Tax=Streptomyces sp. NBC_01433 TaxID=2903864 RepID=UPI00225A9EDB|nr:SpoIIE family protein phosphatase [Streptomyces sp. NBC_01433]MCX4676713.1 SpoIIE family protein phosphatase [Streptomyces sp. NBC_01433]